ncbi:MAG: DUF4230 domain-containing protein [Bacteroidota bacterium]
MHNFFKALLQRLPWVILLVLVMWHYIFDNANDETEKPTTITTSSIITEIESLGKLELIKYNFQEVTEIENAQKIFDFLESLLPANKAVLISRGEAVGCIDLLKLSEEDIIINQDTLYVKLPAAELCYFKVDIENSRIYDLQTSMMSEEQATRFTELLYKTAEEQVKKSAITSGILENTERSAQMMLKALFKKITNKEVVFTFTPEEVIIDSTLVR